MRLNDGEPVWHASVSMWTPDGRKLRSATQVERAAVRLLAGVGNDREWWYWNRATQVGHLRVGLTAAEVARLTRGVAEHDAGESGPERRRTAAR